MKKIEPVFRERTCHRIRTSWLLEFKPSHRLLAEDNEMENEPVLPSRQPGPTDAKESLMHYVLAVGGRNAELLRGDLSI